MKSGRRAIAVLVAVLALGVAPIAHAKVDYSKNSVSGDYATAPAAHPAVDYSKNSVSGEYAPAVAPKAATPVTATDSDFAWGDAAVGAAAALVLMLLVTGARSGLGTVRSRREPA